MPKSGLTIVLEGSVVLPQKTWLKFLQKCLLLNNFGLFSWFKNKELVLSKKNTRFLQSIQYHKTLLLSYQNQNHCIIFQFLHLLRRRLQSRQGAAPGSKPRLAKQSATPALMAVLINPEWYQGVSISKCSNNIYQKTP